jgi:hypothetical protein
MIAAGDGPDRADSFSIYVKWNEQPLFGERHRGAQVRITALPMSEQHCDVGIEDITARSKIAPGTYAKVGFPCTGHGRPVEALSIFRQQT